jgi:hypothetical protein
MTSRPRLALQNPARDGISGLGGGGAAAGRQDTCQQTQAISQKGSICEHKGLAAHEVREHAGLGRRGRRSSRAVPKAGQLRRRLLGRRQVPATRCNPIR